MGQQYEHLKLVVHHNKSLEESSDIYNLLIINNLIYKNNCKS